MARSDWCSRCGEYDVWGKGCRCRLVGRAWQPESGETEDDAHEIWSSSLSSDAIVRDWAARTDAHNCYECFTRDQVVAFRPAGGGPIEYLNVTRESEPVYYVDMACDTDRLRARKCQASTLRAQRRYERQRRERAAAPPEMKTEGGNG